MALNPARGIRVIGGGGGRDLRGRVMAGQEIESEKTRRTGGAE